MVLKCKICGGDLEYTPGQTVATCAYCGTGQTLPRLSDDRRANLYDRAGHFRRNNEFDKAAGIYEQLLAEDPTDAEAYWSLVLCRYGIEYVEDPASHRRLPTVNRAQFTSVFDDENYKAALAHADGAQRAIFVADAEAINEIQKGILAISQKEEPFDVFICYKETDRQGRRTHDSVLAQELYFQLKQEGFKVFFSRITLEDKLGSAYEPYIFAALNSAKVMVVLGTAAAHFNAVWVKNEWSRYLALIKNGAPKVLIPAYRDMDPYDLPEEFSHLQAQDMSRLGFMQDLVRGIKKLTAAPKPKAAPAPAPVAVAENLSAPNVAVLLRRVAILLEDGEFENADDLCDQILNREPENGEAYFYRLLAELGAKTPQDLVEHHTDFAKNTNFQRALRFGDEALKQKLNQYVDESKALRQRKEDEALEWKLNKALQSVLQNNHPNGALNEAKELLMRLKQWSFKPFAAEMIPACEQKIKKCETQIEEAKLAKLRKRNKLIKVSLIAIAVFVALIALAIISYDAVAYETIDGVTYYNNGQYYAVYEVDKEALPADLVIPGEIDGKLVAEIPKNSFANCTNLTSVVIPDSVSYIGNSVFSGCVNLESITIPFVGSNFYNEKTSICFGAIFGPNGNDSVPASLKHVTVASGNIGYKAFLDCYNLISITLLDGVKTIGGSAFSDCNSLTTVNFSDNSRLTGIGSWAFYGCEQLTDITIPVSVKSIGEYAFHNCTSMTTVDFGNNSQLISVGNYAFWWCKSLTAVNFGDNSQLTTIGNYAFHICDSLTTMNFGANSKLTSIGSWAFFGCDSLAAITIPASVKSIDWSAFADCNNLTAVTFETITDWWYTTSSTDTSGTVLAPYALANSATAANYLKSIYRAGYWRRG